jgi:hypothetical protein
MSNLRRKDRKGQIGYRLYKCGRGLHALQVPVYWAHQDETKWLCGRGLKIAQRGEPIWDHLNEGERARETRATHSTLAHRLLSLTPPTRWECQNSMVRVRMKVSSG